MNATSRTLVFVGVAAVAALAATGVRIANRPAAIDGFSDVGQEFFADFQDPLKAMELSVVKYDADAKEPQSFSVKQNEKGLWIIPSHNDYPAEASERLAKTAASLIGIRKVALQSRSKDDWSRYGVEDPSAEVAASAGSDQDDSQNQARGTRITLRDTSSNPLVDLIVGKPVEGKDKHFYVRQPEKNPVFIAKLDVDLSAKFSDWIEPDLLKLNQNDIVEVIVDQYSVDEEQGAILKGEKFEFAKDTASSKWTMAGLDLETESLKESAVTDITRNLDQLKIVGVRQKPKGLNADLTVSREVAQNPLLQKVLQTDMQRQGFYIARGENDEVRLVSNEGELIAGTNNGVKYTLYFGEIARGTAKDIETGLNEAKSGDGENSATGEDSKETSGAEDAKAEETSNGPESGPRRYLLVKVEFDESLLGEKPSEPVAPEKPAILNDADASDKSEEKAEEPGAGTPEKDPVPSDPPKASEDTDPAAEKSRDEKTEEPAPTDSANDESGKQEPESTSADPGSCDESSDTEPAPAEASENAVASEEKPAAEKSTDDKAAPAEPASAPTEKEEDAKTDSGAEETGKTSDENPAPQSATTPAEPAQAPADPKAEAQKQYDQALGEYEAKKAGYAGALKAWEGRAKDGKKKAEELSSRFSDWYYVISADSFEKFKLSRETVVGPKEEPKPADASAAPGPGGIPNFDLPGVGN